jgi:hypothetical protein
VLGHVLPEQLMWTTTDDAIRKSAPILSMHKGMTPILHVRADILPFLTLNLKLVLFSTSHSFCQTSF